MASCVQPIFTITFCINKIYFYAKIFKGVIFEENWQNSLDSSFCLKINDEFVSSLFFQIFERYRLWKAHINLICSFFLTSHLLSSFSVLELLYLYLYFSDRYRVKKQVFFTLHYIFTVTLFNFDRMCVYPRSMSTSMKIFLPIRRNCDEDKSSSFLQCRMKLQFYSKCGVRSISSFKFESVDYNFAYCRVARLTWNCSRDIARHHTHLIPLITQTTPRHICWPCGDMEQKVNRVKWSMNVHYNVCWRATR